MPGPFWSAALCAALDAAGRPESWHLGSHDKLRNYTGPLPSSDYWLAVRGCRVHSAFMEEEMAVYRPRLRDMAVNERPQERMERLGAEALSDTELLAMILRSGSVDLDVISLSSQLIAEAGSLAALVRYSPEDFRRFRGIGKIKALQLATIMEIARRVVLSGTEVNPVVNDPLKVYTLLQPRTFGLDVERFWLLSLNRKNRLIRLSMITSGTATASLVHPREVFREAVRQGATAILCAHNHPSGDPSPSSADIQITRQLREASRAIQIDLLDHIIIGQPGADPRGLGYYSFSEGGLL
ncbi:MAG: DNA repair protein RadC [Opitutales bacterium]|nr:DNA repair protein RadC [Opitutales bacterium]